MGQSQSHEATRYTLSIWIHRIHINEPSHQGHPGLGSTNVIMFSIKTWNICSQWHSQKTQGKKQNLQGFPAHRAFRAWAQYRHQIPDNTRQNADDEIWKTVTGLTNVDKQRCRMCFRFDAVPFFQRNIFPRPLSSLLAKSALPDLPAA